MKTLTTTKCLSLLSFIISISLSSPAIAKMDSYGVIENASLKIFKYSKGINYLQGKIEKHQKDFNFFSSQLNKKQKELKQVSTLLGQLEKEVLIFKNQKRNLEKQLKTIQNQIRIYSVTESRLNKNIKAYELELRIYKFLDRIFPWLGYSQKIKNLNNKISVTKLKLSRYTALKNERIKVQAGHNRKIQKLVKEISLTQKEIVEANSSIASLQDVIKKIDRQKTIEARALSSSKKRANTLKFQKGIQVNKKEKEVNQLYFSRKKVLAITHARPSDPPVMWERGQEGVNQVVSAFQSAGFESERLLHRQNYNVTKSSFIKKFNEYKRSLKPNDTIAIYTHMHGKKANLRNHGGLDFNGELLTWQEYIDLLAQLPAKNIMVFTMACYSGGLLKQLNKPYNKRMLGRLNRQGRNIVVVTSTSERTSSGSVSIKGKVQNPFSYAISQSFSQRADLYSFSAPGADRIVDLDETVDFVKIYTHRLRRRARDYRTDPPESLDQMYFSPFPMFQY